MIAADPDSQDLSSGLYLGRDGVFRHYHAPGSAIFVSDYDFRSAFEERFNDGLTKAELRLLKHLLIGRALSQHGQTDTAYNTRRKQLAGLRHKTGLSRQGELVQVMTALVILRQWPQPNDGHSHLDHGLAQVGNHEEFIKRK